MSRPSEPDLAERIAGLSPAKRELLERRLRERGAEALRTESIPRRVERGTAPLSFAQQRLWFLDQLEPGSVTYNVPRAIRIRGPLNVGALEKVLEELLRRHESLRARFRQVGGNLLAEISPPGAFALPVVELGGDGSPKWETEAEALRLAEEDAEQPFDLARGPILRAKLLRLGAQDHILLLTTHHIASDAWSAGILFREVSALYEAFSAGKPSPLPELPIQYGDFAQWQRGWLEGEVLEEQLSYWKKQLAGEPVLLELPTDRPRPALQSSRGAVESVRFSRELTEALQELSRREGVTLFMTLLAAFQTLLSRYCGQEDIVVGTPIANRNRPEIEGLIGFFINTLVLRTDLTGNPTFRELLGRVREVALGAYAHQDLPFEKLVEGLQPGRDLGRNPLFQTMLALGNTPRQALELAGLSVEGVGVGRKTAKFDLALFFNETSEGLNCSAEYSTDLFDQSTIARLIAHLGSLLAAVAADPEQPLSRVPLLTELERRQLLYEWNDTARDYPTEKTLIGLFEEQADRSPERTALVFGDERLTYRELDSRANRVARRLTREGAGPGTFVGVCMTRSPEMLVGILGILKAGGAYVPMDPGYPRQRLQIMLEDANISVVLTQEGLAETHSFGEARLLRLDADWPAFSGESEERPGRGASAGDLAYVIYTSGSTGRPKGVAIEHRNAVALAHWAKDVFPPEDLAGVLASTSICFDLSIFELFVPLAWGGTVILAQNVLELATLPAAEAVTLINTVPSAMTELLRLGDLPGGVRTVNLAGEPLPSSLVREVLAHGRVQRVFDLYGPSEDTTYSTCAERSPDGPSTIGRPLANKQVYILDGALEPAPVGVAGDLYIGGAGVARGYLNRPKLTAEKFLPDPFRDASGARIYKTGDRARYLPDGNIQFLGRLDDQVKIRGYRIEMGEIETALGQYPGVRASVVLAREEQGLKELVGYLVMEQEREPAVAELRAFLKSTLPDYMVPSAFVFLDAFPLTPSGKVDRRSLPAPDRSRSEGERFLPPRTPIEETLAELWKEILKVDRVGVEDDFFELGGHSLLATQLVSRVAESFNVRLPLRRVFEEPRLEGLALAIAHSLAEAEGSDEMLQILAEVRELSDQEARSRLASEAQSDEQEAASRGS